LAIAHNSLGYGVPKVFRYHDYLFDERLVLLLFIGIRGFFGYAVHWRIHQQTLDEHCLRVRYLRNVAFLVFWGGGITPDKVLSHIVLIAVGFNFVARGNA
jgi:putative copper export protein